jgi:hypothetical protein
MKKVIIAILVIACIIGTVLIVVSKKSSDPLNNARTLENAGNFPQALSSYLLALSQMTDTRPVPSKTKAVATPPETWKKELDNYLSWLMIAKSNRSNNFQTVIEAIDRCVKQADHQNSIIDVSIKKAALQDYQRLWKTIFFPEGMELPENQLLLIQKAMDNGVSMVSLSGNSSYRYEGGFVNCATGKRTDFQVYTEGLSSLLLTPGSYYALITAKAVFPSGKVWVSPQDVVTLTVPDSTSMISAKLKTDIKRRT